MHGGNVVTVVTYAENQFDSDILIPSTPCPILGTFSATTYILDRVSLHVNTSLVPFAWGYNLQRRSKCLKIGNSPPTIEVVELETGPGKLLTLNDLDN